MRCVRYHVSMKRSRGSSLSGVLALGVTVFVVMGVSAVAFLTAPSSLKKSMGTVTTSTAQRASTQSSAPRFFVLDAAGVHLLSADGGETPRLLKMPKERNVNLAMLQGIDVATGFPVVMGTSTQPLPSAEKRSPDEKRVASIAPRRADATSALMIQGGASAQTIVLRLPNGDGIRDAQVLGWWNSQSVAIFGLATSSRALFAADLSGTVRLVAHVPGYIERVRAEKDSVWFVEVTPGPGLEQPDQPPTKLHRLSDRGVDEIVAQEERSVIGSYVVQSRSMWAYQTDDGHVRLVSRDGVRSLGEGTPLLFLDASHLVLRRGNALVVRDLERMTDYRLPSFSDQAAVFGSSPSVIDEILKNT